MIVKKRDKYFCDYRDGGKLGPFKTRLEAERAHGERLLGQLKRAVTIQANRRKS